MNSNELRAIFALAGIMATRLMGLFMILPVFAIYAQTLPDTNPTLVGLAIGIYGFSQALLQIPFGILSDRFGRKLIITLGLILFILGSIVAATSTTLLGIIIGRAMQGSGAIAGAVLALAADLTREEQRTKAMALMGMSIGASFMLALVLGPLLNRWIGIPGIFWFTALLALFGIILLHKVVPHASHSHFHRDAEPVPSQFKQTLLDPQLLRLNIGVLLLHALLTAVFVVLPISLANYLDPNHHWQVYLPILAAAGIVTFPLLMAAEKFRHLKFMFVSAIGVLGLSELGLVYLHDSLMGIVMMLLLFFTAFSLLEASLPSLVSKIVRPESKGTAMGIYSTAQFFGAFLGGLGGGWLHHHYSVEIVFTFGFTLTILWFILAVTMQSPRYLSSELVNLGNIDKARANQLTHCLINVPGVAEVVVIVEDGIAYLKVDRKVLNLNTLKEKCPMMSALLKT